MKVSLPGYISKIMTLRDKTVRLQVDCQEMQPEYMADLFALNDKQGWFFFHEKPIKEIDTEKLPDINFEKWEKHPSKRMQDILFRLWEQTDRSKPFEEFYRVKMDQLCEMLKEKLN